MRLHAGLVCIDAPFGLNLNLQPQLFSLILDELVKKGDLTNQLLEVGVKKDGKVELGASPFPQNKVPDSGMGRILRGLPVR